MFKFKTQRKPRQPPLRSTPRGKVFSYYSSDVNDSTDQSAKTKSSADQRRSAISRREHVRNLPTYLAVIIIIFSILYATTLDTRPQILVGQTSANNSLVRSSATYQSAIQAMLAQSIF